MAAMNTMTALRAHRRGGPEVLTVEQAPIPVPAGGEVLVAVDAAAITFDELTWDETWSRDGVDRTPIIPSHEVSGVVAAAAPGVTDFAVGDAVYGLIQFDLDGAAADYVAVPAADLAARPATLSHVESAALPLAGLTAWQALVDHAKVQPGERVLVHGGAGGVGAFTVQVAHALGAEVTTTVRGDVAELVRGFGADHVVDTRTEVFDAPWRTLRRRDRHRGWGDIGPVVRGAAARRPTGHTVGAAARRQGRAIWSCRDVLHRHPRPRPTGPPRPAESTISNCTWRFRPPSRWSAAAKRTRAAGSRTGSQARPCSSSATREPTMHDLEEAILARHSTRLFLPDKPVPRELVIEALELAVRAPSNSNIQPWRLVFNSGPARDRLVKALLEEADKGEPQVPATSRGVPPLPQ